MAKELSPQGNQSKHLERIPTGIKLLALDAHNSWNRLTTKNKFTLGVPIAAGVGLGAASIALLIDNDQGHVLVLDELPTYTSSIVPPPTPPVTPKVNEEQVAALALTSIKINTQTPTETAIPTQIPTDIPPPETPTITASPTLTPSPEPTNTQKPALIIPPTHTPTNLSPTQLPTIQPTEILPTQAPPTQVPPIVESQPAPEGTLPNRTPARYTGEVYFINRTINFCGQGDGYAHEGTDSEGNPNGVFNLISHVLQVDYANRKILTTDNLGNRVWFFVGPINIMLHPVEARPADLAFGTIQDLQTGDCVVVERTDGFQGHPDPNQPSIITGFL